MTLNWSRYPNFTETEFSCKHTGKCLMRPEFMETLQQIRKTYSKPMVINSGYRDPSHPVEAEKSEPGEHTYGLAADIAVQGEDALNLLVIAHAHGIRRFGLQQKGSARYVHIGMGDKYLNFPASIWTY